MIVILHPTVGAYRRRVSSDNPLAGKCLREECTREGSRRRDLGRRLRGGRFGFRIGVSFVARRLALFLHISSDIIAAARSHRSPSPPPGLHRPGGWEDTAAPRWKLVSWLKNSSTTMY